MIFFGLGRAKDWCLWPNNSTKSRKQYGQKFWVILSQCDWGMCLAEFTVKVLGRPYQKYRYVKLIAWYVSWILFNMTLVRASMCGCHGAGGDIRIILCSSCLLGINQLPFWQEGKLHDCLDINSWIRVLLPEHKGMGNKVNENYSIWGNSKLSHSFLMY